MFVLVVDNDPGLRELLEVTLQLGGHIPVLVGSPSSALSLLKQCQPDAIIVDMWMPEMDGITFIDALTDMRAIPCLVVAEYMSDLTIKRLRAAHIPYLLRMDVSRILDWLKEVPHEALVTHPPLPQPRPGYSHTRRG